MSDDDLIWRGDAVAMLLAMRGPVDVPRTEKAVWVDEGIDRCIEELRDMPAVAALSDPRVKALVEAVRQFRLAIDAFDGTGNMAEKIANIGSQRFDLDAALRAIEGE